MRTARPRLVALVAAFAALAAACGGGGEVESAAAAPQGSGDFLDPSVLTGEAPTIAGDTVDLTTLADKDLVVWFWAPW